MGVAERLRGRQAGSGWRWRKGDAGRKASPWVEGAVNGGDNCLR